MGQRVLVIEDEPGVLSNIMAILSMEGFDVKGVENGAAGVRMALEFVPDLIICDISMPEMNGYEVLVALRKEKQTLLTPFVFLTARAERDDMRHGMRLGADDYLTKPFTVHELLDSVYARLKRSADVDGAKEAALDDLRENMLLSLPHELRTPLTSVLGFSDILIMDGLKMNPEQVVSLAQHINNAGMRLLHLVENYLAYSQIEIIKVDPKRLANLRRVTSRAAHELVEMSAQKMAALNHREEDLTVHAQPADLQMFEDYLKKIVEELVDNAFKFSEADTPVTVTTEIEDDYYLLTVTNYGRGMTRDQIAQIGAYKQFERDLYEQQGSGLGLTIARRLAELHDGRLTIESIPGEETCVRVWLPAAP